MYPKPHISGISDQNNADNSAFSNIDASSMIDGYSSDRKTLGSNHDSVFEDLAYTPPSHSKLQSQGE